MKSNHFPFLTWLALIVIGALVPTLVTVPYFMHLIILALIWVVLAQGQNLIQGFVAVSYTHLTLPTIYSV